MTGSRCDEVVADVGQAGPPVRVGPEHRKADAPCSRMQEVPTSRPQVPVATVRRSTFLCTKQGDMPQRQSALPWRGASKRPVLHELSAFRGGGTV